MQRDTSVFRETCFGTYNRAYGDLNAVGGLEPLGRCVFRPQAYEHHHLPVIARMNARSHFTH